MRMELPYRLLMQATPASLQLHALDTLPVFSSWPTTTRPSSFLHAILNSAYHGSPVRSELRLPASRAYANGGMMLIWQSFSSLVQLALSVPATHCYHKRKRRPWQPHSSSCYSSLRSCQANFKDDSDDDIAVLRVKLVGIGLHSSSPLPRGETPSLVSRRI